MLDQSQLSGKAFRTATSLEEVGSGAGGGGTAGADSGNRIPSTIWFLHIGGGGMFSESGS